MVDIQTISIAIASASVTVAAIYYMWQIRHQTMIRQMEFIMRIPSNFLSKEVFQALSTVMKTKLKNYDDFEEKAGMEARQVGGFCEDLGLLVKRKLVDINLVTERYDVRNLYEKLKPWIKEARKRGNDPRLYEWFEYPYNEMTKREQQLPSRKA